MALTGKHARTVTRGHRRRDEQSSHSRQTPDAVATHALAATRDDRNRASAAPAFRAAAPRAAIAGWQQPSTRRSRPARSGQSRRPMPQRPLLRDSHAPTMRVPGATESRTRVRFIRTFAVTWVTVSSARSTLIARNCVAWCKICMSQRRSTRPCSRQCCQCVR